MMLIERNIAFNKVEWIQINSLHNEYQNSLNIKQCENMNSNEIFEKINCSAQNWGSCEIVMHKKNNIIIFMMINELICIYLYVCTLYNIYKSIYESVDDRSFSQDINKKLYRKQIQALGVMR